MTNTETPLDELWEQIEELRADIGDNDHPDDFVSEREDLAELVAEWEERTTQSQRDAIEGTGGMFTPAIRDGHFFFLTPEGDELDFEVSAGWSSVTPGLPVLLIDTEAVMELDHGVPQLRVELNDSTIFDPKEH